MSEQQKESRMRKVIEEKVSSNCYNQIRTHKKTFIVKAEDGSLCVGDFIILREWDGERCTGNKTKREVTYILKGGENCPALNEGFCIVSLQTPGWNHIRASLTSEELNAIGE